MVSEPTRHKITDLIIVTQDKLVSNVADGEHRDSCDHKLVPVYIKTLTILAK